MSCDHHDAISRQYDFDVATTRCSAAHACGTGTAASSSSRNLGFEGSAGDHVATAQGQTQVGRAQECASGARHKKKNGGGHLVTMASVCSTRNRAISSITLGEAYLATCAAPGLMR
ncbi:MAG: hypothetical protein ACO3JL_11970 [Myxococcota bacterium]